MLIAIDHGNKQVKTVHGNAIVSGVQKSKTRPYGRDILKYGGSYYTLSAQRIPYQKDKTTDERFFILSLFAIAEEIEAQGAYTSGLMPIDLAIGLPPAHFGAQNKAFVRYFKRKEPIYFSYRDKLYSILIRNVQCYPQAFAAAAMMLGELATVPRALILDVGGFTADYLLLKNGRADLSTCDSLENGVILLYNRIRSKASSDLDILLEETDVDAILLQGQGSSYGEEVAALVEYQAQEFVNDMRDEGETKLTPQEQSLNEEIEKLQDQWPYLMNEIFFIDYLKNPTYERGLAAKSKILVCFNDELLAAFLSAYKKANISEQQEMLTILKEISFRGGAVERDETDTEVTRKNLEKLENALNSEVEHTSDAVKKFYANRHLETVKQIRQKFLNTREM